MDKLKDAQMNEELEALKKELANEKNKTKYKAEPVPIPKEQQGLPKGMQQSQIKTVVKDISTIIKEKMLQMKDLATMEVLMDTNVRLRHRLKTIQEMGSANHIKVRGMWKTTPPQMFISNLVGKKINNDEYEISFGVFDTDDDGNKTLYTSYTDVLLHDGSTIKRAASAEYRVVYEVKEIIKTGKAITREVIRIDRI